MLSGRIIRSASTPLASAATWISPGIGNHRRVDLPTSLQKPENRDFSASASTPLAFAAAAKITLINLDLSGKRRGLLHFLGNHLAKPSIKRGRRVPVDANQFGCCPSRRTRNEVLNQTTALPITEPAFPLVHPAILA